MNPIDDCFLSRAEVMRRWRISIATVKRREQQGILRPIRMSTHVIRYRLSDVVRAEDEAAAGREWEGSQNDQKEQDDDREAA
jgi:predicted site-specific integrase-resolvase